MFPNTIPIALVMAPPAELETSEGEPGLSESFCLGCGGLLNGNKAGCAEGLPELVKGVPGEACAPSCSAPPSVDGGSTGGPPPKLTTTAPELLGSVPPGAFAGWSGLWMLDKLGPKGFKAGGSLRLLFSDDADVLSEKSFLRLEPTAAAVAVATILLAALDVPPDVVEDPPPNNDVAVDTIGPNGVPGFGAFCLYEPDANLSIAAMTLPRAPLGLMSSSLPNGMQPPFLHTPRRRSSSVEQRTPSLSVLRMIDGNSRKLILMHK